jgi:hypothetical protein
MNERGKIKFFIRKNTHIPLRTTTQLSMSPWTPPNYQLYQCSPPQTTKICQCPPKTNKKTKMTINFFSIKQKCPYKFEKKKKIKKKILKKKIKKKMT